MITSVTLWRVPPPHPAPPNPPPSGKRWRDIPGGPLIDLPALQRAIRSGVIDEDSVDVVNRKCDKDLDNLNWELGDVLDCLLEASAGDFTGSEWCDTTLGRCLPCDAYSIPYDDQSKCRTRGALKYYLKFSLEEGGVLRLQMVSTHLS